MTHKNNATQFVPLAKRSLLGLAIASALHAPVAFAQEDATATTDPDSNVEVIEVRGIVSSLKRAMADKKEGRRFLTASRQKIWVSFLT